MSENKKVHFMDPKRRLRKLMKDIDLDPETASQKISFNASYTQDRIKADGSPAPNYFQPYNLPVVKIFGDDGAIVIGHGVREFLEQEIINFQKGQISRSSLEKEFKKQSLEELVAELNRLLYPDGGASLEYHDTNGWVGWEIPNFWSD
jgi:hypothetical protein